MGGGGGVFKLNEEVKWTSQAQGCTTTKTGRIVFVLPSDASWPTGLEKDYISHYGGGSHRDHESYLVAVPAKKNGKPHLYWPRVSALSSSMNQ